MRATSIFTASFVFSIASLLACTTTTTGGPGSSGSSGTTTPSRTGVTPCGDFGGGARSCQAGQYCADEGFSKCENGCLSDNNCAGNQTCAKGSATEGSCVNNTATPAQTGTVPTTGPTTSCTDICKKAIACGATQTQQQCEDICKGFTEPCKACINKLACNAPESACSTECK